MDRGFVIKNNDLLFEIYFSATSTHDDRYYSTQVVYSVMLPTFFNYIPDYCGFPWAMKS